jgi:hypothetical protein
MKRTHCEDKLLNGIYFDEDKYVKEKKKEIGHHQVLKF